ncbi:MAG: DUF1738 domain-containing protein, partial [Burkholderiaceae bacterium]|nr:DUF1738 domain-containing protein [Burkholderiaceae bacterium]
MDSQKKSFAENVAEKLIEQLREGTAPWQKPWEPGESGSVLPINPTTGKRYKGINALQLMSEGHSDPRWMTYKQATALDAQVRHGEKGTPIQYWKFTEDQVKTDSTGKPIRDASGDPVKESVPLERPRVFFATVFNAEQIDGLQPIARKEQTWNPVERAEQILKNSGAAVQHGEHDRAFYRQSTDSIHLPDKGQFATAENYYATALHELGHWTGHESRLGRDLAHPFGSEGYAKEELRAEIASMILGDAIGIGHDTRQHAAYVNSWIKVLQNDALEIFRAAADAEKIQDFVLGLEQQLVQDETAQLDQRNAASAMQAATPTGQIAMEVDMGTPGEGENADSVALHAEAWMLARVEQGTLLRALDHATAAQMDKMRSVLHAMSPVNEENSFWQRHVLPADAEAMQERIESASLATDQRLADAPVAAARLDLLTGRAYGRERAGDGDELTRESEDVLGFALPLDWNGRVRVDGFGTETVDGAQVFTTLLPKGVQPDGWGVFGQHVDGGYAMFASLRSEREADELAERLALIDAHSTANEYEKAAKLARIHEERVQRDPNSSDEDIASARELRKNADFVATTKDEDFQRRIEFEERQRSQQAQGTQPASEKVLIDVPYKQKDEAKSLGAKWDRQEQSWFVPPGVDPAPFAKWGHQGTLTAVSAPQPGTMPIGADSDPKLTKGRQYLAVPYSERTQAKAAGAKWDKVAKSWYAGSKADMAKLERWKPENAAAQQDPAMPPREEFAEALRSVGCVVGGAHPIMDGKKHRISVEGEKFSENSGSGFYVGHLDGHPAGYIKNNKTGMELTWKSKGYALDEEQKALLAAEAAAKLQQRDANLSKHQAQAAARVARQCEKLVPVTSPTSYMQAKGIAPQEGALTDKDGKKTYLPAIDAEGKLWSMQYIQEDGTKRFAKDSRKEGCFHAVGGMQQLAKAPALVICEGYATAVELKQTLGYATVSAFDSGNLAIVAQSLHRRFPDKPIVVAGDDDRHLEATQGLNPGRTKAEEAARLVGGKVLLPIFAPGENSYPDGLAPVTPMAYRAHQKAGAVLSEEQQAA